MEKLYYSVSKETQMIDTIEECTGWKCITVYKITNNTLKVVCEFDVNNESNSEEEIKEWLIDNGFEDVEYNFTNL